MVCTFQLDWRRMSCCLRSTGSTGRRRGKCEMVSRQPVATTSDSDYIIYDVYSMPLLQESYKQIQVKVPMYILELTSRSYP